MFNKLVERLENPKRPLLGPNIKLLEFWGILLPSNKYKRLMYIIFHLCVASCTTSECIDSYLLKSNVSLMMNSMKTTMLGVISVIKVFTFLFWQNRWKTIIKYVTTADLNMRQNANETQKVIIQNATRYCRKVTYMYTSLMFTTVAIVVFTPVFMYVFSETYREGVKNGTMMYIEVVSSWSPFDKTTVKGYLLTSAWATCATVYGGGWISSYDAHAVVTMIFFRLELQMLRIDSGNIFGGENDPVNGEEAMRRLKNCYRRHIDLLKHARLFDSCLSYIMLLYIFVCSVMLCVTGYQITLESSATQKFLTSEYLVFGIAQLFIYCWHSNDVLYTSHDLMRGPYESRWWSGFVEHRKELNILTSQFSHVVVFSAGPFTYLTIPTFINILKGAYSYYTLLQKSQIK